MGKIATCKGETLVSSDDNGGGLEKDEVDKDRQSVFTFEQQFDETVPAYSWYMLILFFFFFSSDRQLCAIVKKDLKSCRKLDIQATAIQSWPFATKKMGLQRMSE